MRLADSMKDFDEFKASREKMDPAARKMTDHQWQQAYEAYCRTRRRSRRSGSGSDRSRSHSRGGGSAGRGSHAPSASSSSAQLKQEVRRQSAYADLRLVVDVLAWVAVGLVVLIALIRILGTYDFSFVSLLLGGAFKLLMVFVIRMLAHVLIDIPDIALYRMVDSESTGSSGESDSSDGDED